MCKHKQHSMLGKTIPNRCIIIILTNTPHIWMHNNIPIRILQRKPSSILWRTKTHTTKPKRIQSKCICSSTISIRNNVQKNPKSNRRTRKNRTNKENDKNIKHTIKSKNRHKKNSIQANIRQLWRTPKSSTIWSSTNEQSNNNRI